MKAAGLPVRPAVTEQGEVQQLDGSYISIRECSCPELWQVYPWIGSVDCPIDWHRTRYLQTTWEDTEDEGNALRVDVQGNEPKRKTRRKRVAKAAML